MRKTLDENGVKDDTPDFVQVSHPPTRPTLPLARARSQS